MAKGLTRTSSPIAVSTFAQLTPLVGDAFQSKSVDLQLNPLDNEVFVVTGVKIDFENGMPTPIISPATVGTLEQKISISNTTQTSYAGISQSNVIAATDLSYYLYSDGGTSPPVYVLQEDNAMDTPPANQDYLAIIATNDFHINYQVSGGFALAQTLRANIRVYGYRAKADSSTYAALVQSELLSQ